MRTQLYRLCIRQRGGADELCCGEIIMTEISHIADDIGTRHWPQRDSRFWTGWLEKLVRHRDAGIFKK